MTGLGCSYLRAVGRQHTAIKALVCTRWGLYVGNLEQEDPNWMNPIWKNFILRACTAVMSWSHCTFDVHQCYIRGTRVEVLQPSNPMSETTRNQTSATTVSIGLPYSHLPRIAKGCHHHFTPAVARPGHTSARGRRYPELCFRWGG